MEKVLGIKGIGEYQYYSVIVVKKDHFESIIIDEQHFGEREKAEDFKNTYKENLELEAFVMQM